MEKLYVVKIGGKVIDNESSLETFLKSFIKVEALDGAPTPNIELLFFFNLLIILNNFIFELTTFFLN